MGLLDKRFPSKVASGSAIGSNTINLQGRFDRDTEIESIYLLDHFGVRMDERQFVGTLQGQSFYQYGRKYRLGRLPTHVTGGDLTPQGLPFLAGYNAWEQTISALSHGPGGWIQQLNFALCGGSVLWSAFVWRKILKGGVCAIWYPLIRGIEGVGLLAIAIFTQDPLHTVFLVVIVEAMSIGLFVIARHFWKQPHWRGWVTFSVACGLLPMVLMPIFGIALNTHGVFTEYAGLFERLATNADTLWSLVLLAHLWTRSPIGI